MDVLFWLESIRNPFLDAVMQAVTYLGDEIFFIIIALAIFWCVDKREGYYLLFVGFFGTMVNQFLKLLCRIPRPWVREPSLQIVEGAREGAGGYSFPSGHTQSAVGNFGTIARWNKGKLLRWICLGLILLTGFSRMYLGVHTPADVGVSLLIGTVLVFAFYPIVRKALEKPKVMYAFMGFLLLCSLAFVLYANLSAFPADADPVNLTEGRKNSYSLFGALLAFLIAYPIEKKYIGFSEKGSLPAQVCKVALGLAGLLAVKEGLKLLFSAMGLTWLGMNALRYCAVVLFAALVWPLTFPLWNRMFRKKD
ncbi:MAG: phosphatase PAP2 family protein [Oscillospiraceae bacterium]|nr:phosphatase PAP2 family protein [Oscillospiraceae bacterium]